MSVDVFNTQLKTVILEWAKANSCKITDLVSQLVSLIFDDESFLDGLLFEAVLLKLRKYYRKEVYNPHELLKAIDYTSGVLSYEGIELLRDVERLHFKGKKRVFFTILPARGSMQYYAKKVKAIGQQFCPYETFHCTSGEGFKFDYKKSLELLMKVHRLWDIQDRSIDLSGAIDGNTLTKSVNCITAGIKIIDYRTVCPISDKLINVCYNTEEVDGNILIESRDRCFLMKMIIRQESKEAFQEFEDFYGFMTDLTRQNEDGKNIVYEHLEPMNISKCADMVAHQKALNRGRA